MNNLIFLLPLYNDWDSLKKVLDQINDNLKKLNRYGTIIVVNDLSKTSHNTFNRLSNIDEITILNLKENVGSQKAISIGLKYISKSFNNTKIVTILDSDGEDDVSQIPLMIKNASDNPDKVIVSSRTKRQEKLIFKSLYFFHKLVTFFFTLKWISFGNYSSFLSKNIKQILKNDKSWLAFSACVAINCVILKVYAPRKIRMLGKSKLSLSGLVNHALRVNAVFLNRLSIMFVIYLALFSFVKIKFIYLNIFFSFILIIYYLVILLTYITNKQKNFNTSLDLIKSIEKI